MKEDEQGQGRQGLINFVLQRRRGGGGGANGVRGKEITKNVKKKIPEYLNHEKR